MVAVSESIRKPTSSFKSPMTDHVYSVPLKVLPASTSRSTQNEAHIDTATPRMVTQWAPARPIRRPKKPATTAPNSGANAASK
jgi:hypothetical protein